jgi:hypothetical protein
MFSLRSLGARTSASVDSSFSLFVSFARTTTVRNWQAKKCASKDAYPIVKYHGSYMQSDCVAKGWVKAFQFMLNLSGFPVHVESQQPVSELLADL